MYTLQLSFRCNASAGDTDEITYWGTSSSSSVIVNDHSESVENIKVPNVSADVTSTTVQDMKEVVGKIVCMERKRREKKKEGRGI